MPVIESSMSAESRAAARTARRLGYSSPDEVFTLNNPTHIRQVIEAMDAAEARRMANRQRMRNKVTSHQHLQGSRARRLGI